MESEDLRIYLKDLRIRGSEEPKELKELRSSNSSLDPQILRSSDPQDPQILRCR